MTERVYKILDKQAGRLVDSIFAGGGIIYSQNGKSFEHQQDAWTYLYNIQVDAFVLEVFIDISRFCIIEYTLMQTGSTEMQNTFVYQILQNPADHRLFLAFRSVVRDAVNNGFRYMKNVGLLDFALTHDKYGPILTEMVPPHILQCLDEFYDVGIQSCDIDILGSISLTATETQLTMYRIDTLIMLRTQ